MIFPTFRSNYTQLLKECKAFLQQMPKEVNKVKLYHSGHKSPTQVNTGANRMKEAGN